MKLVSWLVNLLTLLLWECLDANRLIFSLSISHSFQPLDSRSRAQSRCQLLMCCVLRFFLSTSAHIKLTARHYVCWTLLLGFVVLLTWLLPRMANKFVPLLHRPVWTYWRIFVILTILELEHIVSVKESRFFYFLNHQHSQPVFLLFWMFLGNTWTT